MKKKYFILSCTLFLLTLFYQSESLAQHSRCVSRPEFWWACKHLFIAPKAYHLTNLARNYSMKLLRDRVLLDPDGGQLDAFRHAYWMALLASHFKPGRVMRLGIAHEKGNYLDFKKGRLEDGKLPDKISSAMDLYNNQKGVEIGHNFRKMNNDSLAYIIIDSIQKGRMRIILKNKAGEFLQCDGNRIDMESYKKSWFIPKCLVPSIR